MPLFQQLVELIVIVSRIHLGSSLKLLLLILCVRFRVVPLLPFLSQLDHHILRLAILAQELFAIFVDLAHLFLPSQAEVLLSDVHALHHIFLVLF